MLKSFEHFSLAVPNKNGEVYNIQYSPFLTLCMGSIGIDLVISESCYKGTILQMNYRKMTIILIFFETLCKIPRQKCGSYSTFI